MITRFIRTAVSIIVLVFIFVGLSSAQEKNDSSQKHKTMQMKNMKMDNPQMKSDNPIVHKGDINLKAIDKNNDGKVYQDMMDFNVISDKAGNCPLCGMKLKEVSLAKAKANLVKHGFKVNTDKEESSIIRKGIIDLQTIDKNKDGKVYQDMMDYNVISDETGKCPLCGMTLKEVSLEKAKSNLEKTGFKVK